MQSQLAHFITDRNKRLHFCKKSGFYLDMVPFQNIHPIYVLEEEKRKKKREKRARRKAFFYYWRSWEDINSVFSSVTDCMPVETKEQKIFVDSVLFRSRASVCEKPLCHESIKAGLLL